MLDTVFLTFLCFPYTHQNFKTYSLGRGFCKSWLREKLLAGLVQVDGDSKRHRENYAHLNVTFVNVDMLSAVIPGGNLVKTDNLISVKPLYSQFTIRFSP